MPDEIGMKMNINLIGLNNKWSKFAVESCSDCGNDFKNDEVPIRFFRGLLGLALCEICSTKRLLTKVGG